MSSIKERDRLMLITFACLALSFVSTFSYMIYAIINRSSFINQLIGILGVIILVLFSILLVVTGFFIENKKAKIFISIASLLLTFYSIFQIITGITAPKDLVLDFTNYDIKDAVIWAKKRDITVEQEFKYDDNIKEYHIIKQDIKEGTNAKKVKKIKFTISDGVDPTKLAPITNMVGWKLDDVIKFIDDNHLTNVTINFEFSNSVKKDIIIAQDTIKEIKRNDPVTLTSSLGKENELSSVTLDNLVNLDTFHALIYLKRNYLKYSIIYNYNLDKVGIVLNQNLKKWTVIGPERKEEIVLTVGKDNEITVPDLNKMTQTEITEWALENHVKVEFQEAFDDTIKIGKVISYNAVKGSNIKTGTSIKVIISKGALRMIEFTDVDNFKEWAGDNNVAYNIDYQFSDTVKQGDLISSSHNKGEIIKNNDTIKLVISEGGNTSIPNLIDLTKDEALKKCNDNNIKCNFIYLDDNDEYNIVVKQSMRSGSIVPNNTSINLTLGK